MKLSKSSIFGAILCLLTIGSALVSQNQDDRSALNAGDRNFSQELAVRPLGGGPSDDGPPVAVVS